MALACGVEPAALTVAFTQLAFAVPGAGAGGAAAAGGPLLLDPHAESASAPATTTPPSVANRVPFFTGKSPPELMGGGFPVGVSPGSGATVRHEPRQGRCPGTLIQVNAR